MDDTHERRVVLANALTSVVQRMFPDTYNDAVQEWRPYARCIESIPNNHGATLGWSRRKLPEELIRVVCSDDSRMEHRVMALAELFMGESRVYLGEALFGGAGLERHGINVWTGRGRSGGFTTQPLFYKVQAQIVNNPQIVSAAITMMTACMEIDISQSRWHIRSWAPLLRHLFRKMPTPGSPEAGELSDFTVFATQRLWDTEALYESIVSGKKNNEVPHVWKLFIIGALQQAAQNAHSSDDGSRANWIAYWYEREYMLNPSDPSPIEQGIRKVRNLGIASGYPFYISHEICAHLWKMGQYETVCILLLWIKDRGTFRGGWLSECLVGNPAGVILVRTMLRKSSNFGTFKEQIVPMLRDALGRIAFLLERRRCERAELRTKFRTLRNTLPARVADAG